MATTIRKALTTAFLSISAATLCHGAVVVDSTSGIPLARASVADRNGNIIGICDDKGQLPHIRRSSYPLTIHCLGYSPATVGVPTEIIRMSEAEYNLPELAVESNRDKVLHMIGYMREYSTISTYNDTVTLFREKTIDFMIPGAKVKGYPGWTYQRVLASKSYYHFSNTEGLDSVSNRFSQNFSWSDLVGVFRKTELPERMISRAAATDTVFGKFSPSAVWRRSGSNLFLDNDLLASLDRRNIPPGSGFYRMFSGGIDFTRFNTCYVFDDSGRDELLAEDLSRISMTIESKGRGKDLRALFHTSDPVYISTYAEIYITDRQYLSVKEARRWEKKPPLGDEIGITSPTEAPRLQDATVDLIARVDNIDHDLNRTVSETDPFLHVMKKYQGTRKYRKKREKILNMLKH